METVRLVPGVPTLIPGTRCEVRWDGVRQVVVARRAGFWDLTRLTEVGRVLLWERLVDRPHLGWWPVVPLASRATYRSRNRPAVVGGGGARGGEGRADRLPR